MRETCRKAALLAMRCPALLVSLTAVHGGCSNVTQTLFRILANAGLYNDQWPRVITDMPHCFGLALSLVMLFASDDNLLRLYSVVLPGMLLILTNYVATQQFLNDSCFAPQLPPPPPPLPTGFWSQLLSYLTGIVDYFVGSDVSAAVHVEEPSCDCMHRMLHALSIIILLALVSGLVNFITAASSRVERIALTVLVDVFVVPCSLRLVGARESDVELANTCVCLVVRFGVDIWSTLCLERMLYTSVRYVAENAGAWYTLFQLWYGARCCLFVSWLTAFSAQVVDSLLAVDVSESDITYELLLHTLRHGSWSPLMYLGLCSAAGYLTDAVWKSVHLLVARSTARNSVTDNGLSELLTLVHARLLCLMLGISVADMFTFVIPYLVGLLAVKWVFRVLKPLLQSAHRSTFVAACAVLLATIIALPSLVYVGLVGEKRFYIAGNLFIALRYSIRGASMLIQSLVGRWYSAADDYDANEVNFIVRVVADGFRVCLGCYVVVDLIYIDALYVHAAMSQPGFATVPRLVAVDVGRFASVLLQTYCQAWLIVYQPLQHLLDKLQKHYGAPGRVRALPKLAPDDRRLGEACAVCWTAMDVAAGSCLTPCGHAFHLKCLELSLRASRDCPICRHQLLDAAAAP